MFRKCVTNLFEKMMSVLGVVRYLGLKRSYFSDQRMFSKKIC